MTCIHAATAPYNLHWWCFSLTNQAFTDVPTCIEMSAFCNLHGVVVVVYINVVVILCSVLCMVSGESFSVATCTVWWWLYVVVTLCSVVTSLLDMVDGGVCVCVCVCMYH